jgi:hypothetical protein
VRSTGLVLRAGISGHDARRPDTTEERPMYDMYPEWGPAKNRDDEGWGEAHAAVQVAFDGRDAEWDRPDDN